MSETERYEGTARWGVLMRSCSWNEMRGIKKRGTFIAQPTAKLIQLTFDLNTFTIY